MSKIRKCDRCGGKAAPFIPRKRSNSGTEMLCAGCKQSDRSERVAAVMKVAEIEDVPDRRPYGTSTSKGTDFGWDDDLAPEGHHPLMAPLPTSVWERYAKKQELRGKPLVPMASQSIINSRMRGEHHKDASLTRIADNSEHGALNMMAGKGLVQHLQDHHNLPAAHAHIAGSAGQSEHYKLHEAGETDHTHGPNGDVIPNGPAGQSDDGKKLLTHPAYMGDQGLTTHLTEHHGLSPQHLQNAFQAASPSIPKQHTLQALHNKAHSTGFGTEDHEHQGGFGLQSFKHQTPHTAEEHIAHLKSVHGLTDEDLGHEYNDSPFEDKTATLAHVHDSLHDGSVTDHLHTGHKDVGKPFTGVTGNPDTANDVHAHLMHKHGLSTDELDKHVTPGMPPFEKYNTWENHHADLHKQNGESFDHQHVPTVHPDVKSPELLTQEALHKHLKEDHGITGKISGNGDFDHKSLHDPDAYDYKGHPGHEHGNPGSPTEMTTKLPGKNQHLYAMPGSGHEPTSHKFHFAHPEDMGGQGLKDHLALHHGSSGILDSFLNFDSHEQDLQKHAQAHATGDISDPHSHEISQTGHDEFGHQLYGGKEPEPSSTTHPAVENESAALAHIIKHHPNISAEEYNLTKGNGSSKLSMVDFHHKLHHPENGYAYPSAPDGHDHADPQGPHTDIPIGSHLVSHHGLSQEQVSSMTPAEFKAHHEELHARHPELDLGHGHLVPGGPVRPPRTMTSNPHHAEMRGDLNHPAVHEWYHGTSTDFDGPPKNATELQEDHGFWGNFGAGDWNNHAGTHWTSLHQMARNFNGGPNRVIHAKLHMGNPITYNSLNHMSHDAYDRLHASGDLQDDGHFLGRHDDDNGYNHCCSGRLLEYAKGEHRSDGKFGMERYRDSLRASGHDGIVVRNQADSPEGHWNAIPLSADQIEVTDASCHGAHNDERDDDVREFRHNESKLTKGWEHPKHFDPMDYTGGKPLPNSEDVDKAGTSKHDSTVLPHIQEGRGSKRGDADPYRLGRDFASGHSGDDDDDMLGDEEHYCEHCDEWGDHKSKDCDNKWCSVCDEHTDHTAEEEHPYCEHCDGHADHDSEDHEDEWGEHPDKINPEGYCPSCEHNSKDNYGKSKCTNCGENLPDWGKKIADGKPMKSGEYQKDGETDEADFGTAHEAPLHHSQANFGPGGNEKDLAAHLYHHHKSDVGGKEFENEDGGWDGKKLQYHHQHLHADPQWAASQGFQVDHDHKSLYPQFKSHEDMTPTEVHAHMLLAHATSKDGGSVGAMSVHDMLKMSPEEAVKHHKILHAADDAIHWGSKDFDGDLIPKISHSHQLPADTPTKAPTEHSPTGEDLSFHLKSMHGLGIGPTMKTSKAFTENPDLPGALHQQLHDNYGPAAEENNPKFHTHLPEGGGEQGTKKQMLDHLADHHGISHGHPLHSQFEKMNSAELHKAHDQEHNSLFPMGAQPEHGHASNNPNVANWMNTNKQAVRHQTLTDVFEEAMA